MPKGEVTREMMRGIAKNKDIPRKTYDPSNYASKFAKEQSVSNFQSSFGLSGQPVTEEQGRRTLRKLWDKHESCVALEDTIMSLPAENDGQRMVKLAHLKEYHKVRGFYKQETANTTTNNILVVSREETRELWKQRAKKQQRATGR